MRRSKAAKRFQRCRRRMLRSTRAIRRHLGGRASCHSLRREPSRRGAVRQRLLADPSCPMCREQRPDHHRQQHAPGSLALLLRCRQPRSTSVQSTPTYPARPRYRLSQRRVTASRWPRHRPGVPRRNRGRGEQRSTLGADRPKLRIRFRKTACQALRHKRFCLIGSVRGELRSIPHPPAAVRRFARLRQRVQRSRLETPVQQW